MRAFYIRLFSKLRAFVVVAGFFISAALAPVILIGLFFPAPPSWLAPGYNGAPEDFAL